jgi:hypothetical protein
MVEQLNKLGLKLEALLHKERTTKAIRTVPMVFACFRGRSCFLRRALNMVFKATPWRLKEGGRFGAY